MELSARRDRCSPLPRDAELVVFGFDQAFRGAAEVAIDANHRLRIAVPDGYALLKARAITDRIADHDDKHARDLAVVLFWFQQASDVLDEVYDLAGPHPLWERYDSDTDLGAAHVLGRRVVRQLTNADARDIRTRWNGVDPDLLARAFQLPAGTNRAWGRGAPQRYLEAMTAGMEESADE